jgi:hypothetical protein
MNRFYLALATDGPPSHQTVSVCPRHADALTTGHLVRTSPIYRAFPVDDGGPPMVGGSGQILFLFTLDTFVALGLLRERFAGTAVLRNAFATHGLASLLLFSADGSEFPGVRETLAGHFNGYETWTVDNGVLRWSCEPPTNGGSDTPRAEAGIVTNGLDHDDYVLVAELRGSLSLACALANAYAPQYRELLDALATDVRSIVASILFLNGRRDESGFRSDVSNGRSRDEVEATLAELLSARGNDTDRHVIVHQFKDELVQISAVLKTFNSQAFAGCCPIVESSGESGRTSLLGIGGALAALFSFYRHVRRTFGTFIVDRAIRRSFGMMQSPSLLPNPAEYERWIDEIDRKRFQGVNEALTHDAAGEEVAFHIVYFSNRLGFRETKRSISAAYQSIFLGAMPPWSIRGLVRQVAVSAATTSSFAEAG